MSNTLGRLRCALAAELYSVWRFSGWTSSWRQKQPLYRQVHGSSSSVFFADCRYHNRALLANTWRFYSWYFNNESDNVRAINRLAGALFFYTILLSLNVLHP
ncbi:hypothetical protein KCP74_17595 [Salmonella enterica subsp. enterica]|nr:hypothetical protein KCP74_17595 [Salmonella enterica subsp. enterica]